MAKIVARIRGGLGNQLFCYASARRLSIVNNAELVLDAVTGFARDKLYHRKYSLDWFHIPCRKATAWERLEPLERFRRGVAKLVSRHLKFSMKRYVEEECIGFDPRLLDRKVHGTVHLDGLWQSEKYFKDVELQIRDDLRIVAPEDELNSQLAREISDCESVAVHVRRFDEQDSTSGYNMATGYYVRALNVIHDRVPNAHFFLFSDDPVFAREKIALPDDRLTSVCHNTREAMAYADLWLMTRCRHFITANSTFSWWGAWLCPNSDKIIVTPKIKLDGKTCWGFDGLIPEQWIRV